jgi:group I intron endonuclease
MGTIYVFENLENGMKYVGQTVSGFKKRLRFHLNPKNKTYFTNALSKYGLEGFNITLKNWDDDKLNEEEIRLIKSLDCLYPNGYNLDNGGGSGIHCLKIREKISNLLLEYYKSNPNGMKGKNHSLETRNKMSNSKKGVKNHRYGIKMSNIIKERISKKLKGVYIKEKSSQYGKVINDVTKIKISVANKLYFNNKKFLKE